MHFLSFEKNEVYILLAALVLVPNSPEDFFHFSLVSSGKEMESCKSKIFPVLSKFLRLMFWQWASITCVMLTVTSVCVPGETLNE